MHRIAFALILLASTAFAETSGEAIYETTCAACHGANANGVEALGTPNLRGQHAAYLKRQLTHFRNGVRSEGQYAQTMAPIAKSLTAAQISAVTQYLSSLTPVSQGIVDVEPLFTDRNCVSCHGEDGRSSPNGMAPSIAGQKTWYVVRQLSDFKAGLRGTHKSDLRGRMMRPQAQPLSDEQIRVLADYVSTL